MYLWIFFLFFFPVISLGRRSTRTPTRARVVKKKITAMSASVGARRLAFGWIPTVATMRTCIDRESPLANHRNTPIKSSSASIFAIDRTMQSVYQNIKMVSNTFKIGKRFRHRNPCIVIQSVYGFRRVDNKCFVFALARHGANQPFSCLYECTCQ